MNAIALALHSGRAVRDALRAAGWDEGVANNAAGGLMPLAIRLSGLDPATLEALVPCAGRLGLDVTTGADWALLVGSRARLGAFARPSVVPPELAEAAMRVGLAIPGDPPAIWRAGRFTLALDRPLLVGILNVTPDSFTDGGRYAELDGALAHAERLLADGADVLDVGGESTRPGRSIDVPLDEELRRVLPVVQALAAAYPAVPLSIDTVKAAVARSALDAGATIVNDVSGGRLDPELLAVAAAARAGVVLMHSRGSVTELGSYVHADYSSDPVGTVRRELAGSLATAAEAGVPIECIALDPGFGFSKTTEQSLLLLDRLDALAALGRPLLVGPSRKRFLGAVTGRGPDSRDVVTAAACALAYERGARIFRVHDVGATRDALALASALGRTTAAAGRE